MESMLESKPFDYNMEDICFGDDNAKAEKAKQSFLQLKQKICRTNDVLQKFSNKSKECEHLRLEVENIKREGEKWKKQHFESLAKNLELKTARIAIEKNNKLLNREKDEMEIKIAGDQKLIQQLMCKLGDIEDEHSEKIMTLELEKSGFQTKVAELEKEIKVLQKTHGINKDDIISKNPEKPKRGRRIKSPIKTTRSTGLLSEIGDSVNFNVEMMNVHTSTPQHPANLNKINTTEIGTEIISTNSDLPKLFNVDISNDNLKMIPKYNLLECKPTPKPITCDKNIMTDEFYGIKDNVYPLLCDKCEARLESMPVDKIFKIMTTHPPLISTVPPSPVRSRPVDREIQTIDIPIATNVSVQNDSTVSLVLDKVQQTLEILEKQMKKNDENRRNDQSFIPHCSHTLPTNCCNHSNDSINDKTLSQVNMMTTLWSSMMKFADKRLPKRHVRRKKLSNIKPKHRREIKKKLKQNLNSWIVESDTSLVTDRDLTTSSTPTKLINGASVSKHAKEKVTKSKERNLFNPPVDEPEKHTAMASGNTDANSQMYSEISPHIGGDVNTARKGYAIQSFENASTSTPSSHSTNLNLAVPKIDTKAQSISTESIQIPPDVDPTARKQMRPTNVAQSMPKSRNGLLQKLRRLSKNKTPVNIPANINKDTDYLEATNEGNILPAEKVPETKKRIAHTNITGFKKPDEIMNSKRTKVTRSMTKSEEMTILMSPKSPAITSIHSPTSPKCSKENTKCKRVSRTVINNLFGSDCDEDKIVESTVSDVVDNIINCTTDIVDASECAEKHNEVLNIQSCIKNDEPKDVITNIPTSNFDTISQCIKSPLIIGNAEIHIGIDRHVVELEKNYTEALPKLIQKNDSNCSSDKMEIDSPNKSTDSLTESLESVGDNQDCGTNVQSINSPVNSPMKNALPVVDTSTTPRSVGTRSARSLCTQLSNSTSDENGKTLQKRRRTDSLTKNACEKTPEFLTGNNDRLVSPSNSLANESESVSPKSSKKKSVPEIIQNELGKFFSTKRMTRSMKKSEESLLPTSDTSQVKINSLKRLGCAKTVKNTKTPVKSTNTTPKHISKSFVKSLFPSYNCEKKNLNSKLDDDSNEFEYSASNKIETPNSIAIDSNTCDNNADNKSEIIIDYAVSELNNGPKVQEPLSIENRIEIGRNIDEKELLINDNDKDKVEKNKLSRSYGDNDLDEKSSEERANNMETSTDHVNTDKKISNISSTCDYDSPLSPDPIPSIVLDCPASPDSNVLRECLTTASNESTHVNTVQLSTDRSVQQSYITRQQMQKKIDPVVRLTKDSPKYRNSSVKELRNRMVPVLPQPIQTTSKNNPIVSSITEKANIKSLLDNYLSLAKVPEMRPPKYLEPAAKRVSAELIDNMKLEIMRFINSPDWDNSIFRSAVDNISKIESSKAITRAIINVIEERSVLDEPTDHTHTPPAPPMTMTQQKIIAIIKELDKVKPDLFILVLNAFNYNLFHVKQTLTMEQTKSFAKIFIVLSKIKKDRERVRLMICDALYSLQSRSLVIVHVALTCWPEVLPMYDENRRDYLTMCIVHLIKYHDSKTYLLTTIRNQLKNLVKNYYKYPDGNPLSANMVDQLLNEITTLNYDKKVLTAILLLAKQEGTEWTYKYIIKQRLLEIIIENKNSSAYNALILLGWLMKCFPIQDSDGSVKNIVEQLCGILNAGTMTTDIQEGAVMALMLISNRHLKYYSIVKSILMWRPPRPLSPALQKQLEILFKSRTREEWQRIKMK